MSTNYLAVYEALKLFRDATLAFIRTQLERVYGERWWEQGVRRGFKPEDIQKLEEEFRRRFQSPLGPARPGQELYEILDVPWFTNIFDANWKQAFAEPCHNDRTVLALLREVAQLRNPVAHPETGDLQYDDAWRGMDSMERLLRLFDPSVAAQVKGIKERLQAGQPPVEPAPPAPASEPAVPAPPSLPIENAVAGSVPKDLGAGSTRPVRSVSTIGSAAGTVPYAEALRAAGLERTPPPAVPTPSPSGNTLQRRIQAEVRAVLGSYPGAWMVWCDPRGDWTPLLEHAAADSRYGFPLVAVAETSAGAVGSPAARAQLQTRIEAGEGFVLLVPAEPQALGWLWAQALRGERIYGHSLREALLGWGWQPQSLTLTDDMLAVLAMRNRHQDPAEWGGGGLQPDLPLLLEVLAGSHEPRPDERLILDLTIEHVGLPPLEAPLPVWRARSLARLLVTQAYVAAPQTIGEGHELLIAADRRKAALQLVERWLDSLRLSKNLPDAILEADKIAALAGPLAQATLADGPFLSYAAERAVFAAACRRLTEQSGSDPLETLAAAGTDLRRHVASFWCARSDPARAIAWGELLRLSEAAALLREALPAGPWATPAAAIAWYTGGGWRVDGAGEEILRDLGKSPPELLALITPLRASYRARWEHLMLAWSDVWTAAGCPVPELGTAGEWLQDLLQNPRPTAILVADALRYDLGATLAADLNKSEGTERATVHPARSPLPSITALGMGQALPLSEDKLEADIVEGKWQLHLAGRTENLSLAAERRNWWHKHGKVADDGITSLAQVMGGAIPAPAAKRARLLIYDDAIDKLGHDDELEAMGSRHIRARYLQAIGRLRDTGWLRILVVTDHGYIHWSGTEERGVTPPAPDPAYQSRRALAYPHDTALTGPRGVAPGGRWRVAVAPGAASFKAYGGLGYFHGGASLQEWIIPCVRIEWPSKAQPVAVALQTLDKVLGERLHITLNVIRADLLGENDLPREVQVLIRDAAQNTVLYRSHPVVVRPNETQARVEVRTAPGAVAERGIPLRIEVRDTHTEEVLATGTSILMTELSGW